MIKITLIENVEIAKIKSVKQIRHNLYAVNFVGLCSVVALLPTLGICEERVLKHGQPVTKAILKNQKFKLKTKAKLLIVSRNQSCHFAEVEVTTVRPFFANTACWQ